VNTEPNPSPALSARNRAAVQIDDVTHNRESQSHAGVVPGAGTVGLPEALEHERQKVRIDADARVGHCDRDILRRRCQAYIDMTARGRELDGVGEQVPKNLLHPIGIAGDARIRGLS